MKLGKYTVKFDWQHWALLGGSAAVGALVTYFESIPTAQFISGLQSWTTAQPLLWGALVAVGGALLTMAKHTFLTEVPPVSPDSVQRGTVDVPKPTSFLPPPANKRVARFVGAIAMAAVVTSAVVVTGSSVTACTPAQWQTFQSDAAMVISYVQTFLQGASAVWAMISPALGPASAVANAAFNVAFTAVTTALAVAQDAIKAANAAQQPLDMAALLAPIQDAVAKVMAVIAEYQKPSGAALGTASNSLEQMAAKIQAWK